MLLDLVCAINIIIVGVVSDDDAGILHHILDEAKPWKIRIREGCTRIRSVEYLVHDGKYRFSERKLHIFRDIPIRKPHWSVSSGASVCIVSLY